MSRKNTVRPILGAALLLLALTAAAAPDPAVKPSASAIAWSDNLDGALARARNEFKPVLVIFTSPGCPWCERFKRETLAEREVLAALENFICVEIDTTRDSATPQRHQIRNVPATLILSGDGRAQWGMEGFMDMQALLKFIDVYRHLGASPEGTPPWLDGWLQALRTRSVEPRQWPEIISALGDKACRTRLHPALIAYTPAPRQHWVELLAHDKLAVRLGVFELLEVLAGSAHGYDPWGDAMANREALKRWQTWAATDHATAELFAPVTEEQVQGYIRDLAAEDRARNARAVRLLEQAGKGAIPPLEAWLSSAGALEETMAVRQVKEVRYFLLLPESLGTERTRLAHRLIFGNQDERLRSLEAVARGGARSLPVLSDFLADPDPFLREAAVDAVISADRNRAIVSLRELLQTEKDEAVIHAVIRGAGRLKAAHALELAGPYLTHTSEDLVVAALASLSRTKSTPSAKAVADCLMHPQWRVRAAALEALAQLNSKRLIPEVTTCLEDADLFVRRTAVATLASLAAKKSAPRLSECFLQDDPLKGPVVAALREMDIPLPQSFGPALRGKDVDVLLSVLDALGSGSDDSWRLALPYLHHENGDVAYAAIRVVTRGGGRAKEVRKELAKVLRGGVKERMLAVLDHYPPAERSSYESPFDPFGATDFDALVAAEEPVSGDSEAGGALAELFAAFSPGDASSEKAPAAATKAPPIALGDLFDAFGTTESANPKAAPAAEAREDADLLQEIRDCLAEQGDPELRFAAALSLLATGDDHGAVFLLKSLDTCTAAERLKIVQRVERCTGEATTALSERLLRDPSTDVRRAAVSLALKPASDRLLQAMLATVFEPQSHLLPADLLQYAYAWYRSLQRAATRRIVGDAARQLLDNTAPHAARDDQRILALTLLDACWQSGDQTRVQAQQASDNPFVRRAAWLTLGRHRRATFLQQLDTVAHDSSEWVRAVVPLLFLPESVPIYFDATTTTDGLSSYYSSSPTSRRLEPAVVTALTELCRDPAPAVRNTSALCLLAYREKLDVRLLSAMLDTAADKSSVAYRIESLLEDLPLNWLREQNNAEILYLLDTLLALKSEADDDANKLSKLRQHLAATVDGGTNATIAVSLRHDEPYPAWAGALQAAGPDAPAATPTVGDNAQASHRQVIFFRNPGCRDCAQVAEMLAALAAKWRDLQVEVRDLRKPEDARINEALCARFNVPFDDHLTAPAVFCGSGALLKEDITFERLQRLLSRPEAMTTGWHQLTEAEKEQAGQQIEAIYSSLTPLLVFGFGLVDGVNPCAFATIIFLLSYLQVARRKPRELLIVGSAFMAGVFLAYFVLGLGLVEVVARLTLLRRFALLFNWGLALFVAAVALLNFWDGVQCLRGRMGEMVLQLPASFKARIHDVVRHSTRHRRFVLAAFLAGMVISLLELACTGQVYAPTLIYIMKTGVSRRGVFAYLLLYNVAFVIPLAFVFYGAYSGLRSERLTQWLQRRAAGVKFATAALFTALLILLILRLNG